MYLASLLVAAGVMGIVTATDPDPERYSSCWADRGYLTADATLAGNILAQNNTFSNGTFMLVNSCIYNRYESTVVSLCNGDARNRTVYRDEVSRGIEQLTKDCNIDDAGFSGVHVVNNLTFAAYGIYGGKDIKVPPGANPPDTPPVRNRKRSNKGGDSVPPPLRRSRYVPRDMPVSSNPAVLGPRQQQDPCLAMGYDGKSRYDCAKKEGHTVDKDTGVCGTPSPQSDTPCSVYCEIRRTGFLGLEEVFGGQGGTQYLPSTSATLAVSTEYTVTHGISASVEGVWEDIIGGGVTYEWSTSVTHGKTTQIEAQNLDDVHPYRWVFFPKYLETCGDVSRRTLSPGIPNPNGGQTPPTCSGDIETLHNICALTPEIDPETKQPIVYWAIRYEDFSANVLPIDQQHTSYKSLCKEKDPDHDNEQECAVGG